MSSNQPIKIVKRKERELLEAQQQLPECEVKTEGQTRRDMFETVASWIKEQREAKQALRSSLARLLAG